MSSILDALKKSERQRSLGRDLIYRNASADAAPRLTGFAIAVLATLLVLVAAIGALLFSLHEPESPVVPSPAGTASPPTGHGTLSSPASGDTSAAPPPTTTPTVVPSANSTPLSNSQTVPATSRPVFPIPAKPANALRNPEPAPLAPASGAAPWLSSLPQAFRGSLPPLAVNIHVYSPDQSQRILYINNHPLQQGERIEGGVVVEEIVHDGVVLQFRGQRFKLPRPS